MRYGGASVAPGSTESDNFASDSGTNAYPSKFVDMFKVLRLVVVIQKLAVSSVNFSKSAGGRAIVT